MAKSSGKGARAKSANSNGEHKARKKKADKPSAEQLTDQEYKKRLYMYVGRYKPALAAKKEAADDVRALIEEAKSAGIPKKDIELAIELETAEGELSIADDVKRIFRVARWAGSKIGTQLELFAKPDKKIDPVFDEGYRAGLRNEIGKPPAHHGQNAAQRWLSGYHDGLKHLNETRAERFGGMKPLGAVAAAVAEGLGKEAPTHQEAA
jgi:hypothetical protein